MVRTILWFIVTAIAISLYAALMLTALTLMVIGPASGHEAPSGWTYPYECCSKADCDVVVKMGEKDGKQTLITKMHGEVPVPQTQWQTVRPSGDNQWHLCAQLQPGSKGYRYIYCIFAPSEM